MNSSDRVKDWSLNAGLALLGVGAILLATQIPDVGAGSSRDPGPRAFPIALSVFLIAGAALLFIQSKFNRPGAGANSIPDVQPVSWAPAGAAAPPRANAVSPESDYVEPRLSILPEFKIFLLCIALVLYLLLMPWAGFTISTLFFSLVLMRALGASWKLAAAVSLGLVTVVLLLFVWGFRVQLPRDALGLAPF